MSRLLSRLVMLGALGCATSLPVAQAREPGIAPVTPPGLTLGLPIALSLPEGAYLIQRSSYLDAELDNASGHYNGQKVTVFVNSSQLTYVPGLTILGATYKAFIIVPFISEGLDRTTTATGPLGQFNRNDFANPKIEPLNLTWNLGGGFNVGAGVGVYVPLGQYTPGKAINLGADFYTIESSLGFTYFKDGWNASVQAVYDTNTRNEKTEYLSGDEAILNVTVTKNVGGFNIGPVAYYLKQVTGDSNNGGRAVFGGNTFSAPYNLAFGGLISHSFGPVSVTAYITRDVSWSNTIGGTKGWLGVSFKFI